MVEQQPETIIMIGGGVLGGEKKKKNGLERVGKEVEYLDGFEDSPLKQLPSWSDIVERAVSI